MGIIEKQATKNAIYSYIGAGLGFLTVIILGNLLTTAENGARGLLISYSALFAQFANLGFTSVTNRFFPYFKNKDKGHHGFLFYAIIVSIIGFLLCYIVFIFLQPQLIENNQLKSPLFNTVLFYLMPLTFFTVFFNMFDNYLRAGYSSVIGSFAKEFLQRVFILLAIGIFYLKLIDFKVFILLYVLITCLPALILLFYIIQQKEWHVKPVSGFMSKELRNEMIKLGSYSILAGGAGAIVLNIDAIMVNNKLGESATGIYGIAIQMGAIMLIPARSLYRIMTTVVAEAFKKNDIPEITSLYEKSCNSQLTIGVLLFIGIYANINNIMHLIPAAYASGKNVILILCIGYLVEMATGINQVIIANSKYYKYDTAVILLLVVVIIISNYILIPIYGISGSAIATVISSVVVNSLRYYILYWKYKMQPYNYNSIKLVAVGIMSYLSGYFIPPLSNFFLDIALRSALTGGVFLLLILKTEAAPEINGKIRKNLKRFSIKA